MSIPRLTAVDVFAGAGGLSLGMRRARFDIKAAVEIDPDAVATYKKNHRGVQVIDRDVKEVSPKDILRANAGKPPSLLMGCAPCQGFCSLTRKWQRLDPRNDLVLELSRLVEATLPDAVFMENVPGLAVEGKPLFDRFLRSLRSAGYYAQWWIVQMADYGVPQNRRRLVLLAGRGFSIALPQPTHSRSPDVGSGLKPWRTLRDAIGGRRAPVTLGRSRKSGGPSALNWHVVRDLQEQTKERLRAARPGSTWLDYDESLRPACHRGNYDGFRNVYGRMSWNQLPVTITAGCTTPAKGRFGHPDRRRTTISVREAAAIQTFPDSYKLVTEKIDRACDLVGNAVPPLFAQRVGVQIHQAVNEHRRLTRNRSS